MVALTKIVGNRRWPDPRLTGERESYVCSFCCEERHNGGTHLRVREIPGGTGEETIIRIPHAFAA